MWFFYDHENLYWWDAFKDYTLGSAAFQNILRTNSVPIKGIRKNYYYPNLYTIGTYLHVKWVTMESYKNYLDKIKKGAVLDNYLK